MSPLEQLKRFHQLCISSPFVNPKEWGTHADRILETELENVKNLVNDLETFTVKFNDLVKDTAPQGWSFQINEGAWIFLNNKVDFYYLPQHDVLGSYATKVDTLVEAQQWRVNLHKALPATWCLLNQMKPVVKDAYVLRGVWTMYALERQLRWFNVIRNVKFTDLEVAIHLLLNDDLTHHSVDEMLTLIDAATHVNSN